MTTDTVEGFSNYATAGVAMTLDNDRMMDACVQERVERARLDAPTCEQVREGLWTVEEATRFILADSLKDYAERLCERGIFSGAGTAMASQMVQAGLSEVDWHELADYELSVRTDS